MVLLERDELLDELSSYLLEARGGRGSLALVAGEAGAGKTSLIKELEARAAADVLVMEGACDPLSTPRPLSPLVDIAADPDSGLGDLFDSSSPLDAFALVLDRLRHTLRPILLIIEDVHWADDGTLDFIRFVGRRVGDTRALMACTYRDDEVGPDHPFRVVLGDLAARSTTHRFSVPALSEPAVRDLASGTSYDSAQLHRLTDGNAFFVTEILASDSALPETVQDAVLARVARLSPQARQVANAVSIAPRSLSVDLVLAMSDAMPSDVDEALTSGVLVEAGGELRFRHELARSAVEEALPPMQRLTDHRRMIALLQDREVSDLARLVHHAARAEDGALVVEFAPRAAAEAATRMALRESVSMYSAALAFAELANPDDVARWRIDMGRALVNLDRVTEALEQQQNAVDYFRSTNADVDLARALIAVSTTRWQLAELEAGRAAVEEAVEILQPLGSSSELAYAWWCSGYLWMLARQHQKSIDALSRSKEIAAGIDDEATLKLVDYIMGTTEVVTGDAKKGVDLLKNIYEEAAERNDTRMMAMAMGMLGSGGGEIRQYEEAIPALEVGIALSLDTDADYSLAYDRAWLARIAFEQGRWDDAVEYAEMVADNSPGSGVIAPVTALGALGRVRVRRGDPGASQALKRALEVGANCEMQHVWSPYCGLAEMAWLDGRQGAIPDILEDIYRRALATDSPWARGEVGFWMWKAGAIEAPPDNAAEPFRLQMEGDWASSARVWHEIGCPYEAALALADGDEPAMLESLAIFDSLGARPAGQWMRAQLRERGISSVPRGPTRETRGNPAGLTNRQLEVLKLMLSGATNGEIAKKLYVSKKTVENHVSAVLSKLGVSTRAKAIVRASELMSKN